MNDIDKLIEEIKKINEDLRKINESMEDTIFMITGQLPSCITQGVVKDEN